MNRDEREYLRYLRDVHQRNQDGLCYWCDVEMTDAKWGLPRAVTLDQKKPVRDGGGSNALNTVAACFKCNQERATKATVGKKDMPVVRLYKKPEPDIPTEPDQKVKPELLKYWATYPIGEGPIPEAYQKLLRNMAIELIQRRKLDCVGVPKRLPRKMHPDIGKLTFIDAETDVVICRSGEAPHRLVHQMSRSEWDQLPDA